MSSLTLPHKSTQDLGKEGHKDFWKPSQETDLKIKTHSSKLMELAL